MTDKAHNTNETNTEETSLGVERPFTPEVIEELAEQFERASVNEENIALDNARELTEALDTTAENIETVEDAEGAIKEKPPRWKQVLNFTAGMPAKIALNLPMFTYMKELGGKLESQKLTDDNGNPLVGEEGEQLTVGKYKTADELENEIRERREGKNTIATNLLVIGAKIRAATGVFFEKDFVWSDELQITEEMNDEKRQKIQDQRNAVLRKSGLFQRDQGERFDVMVRNIPGIFSAGSRTGLRIGAILGGGMMATGNDPIGWLNYARYADWIISPIASVSNVGYERATGKIDKQQMMFMLRSNMFNAFSASAFSILAGGAVGELTGTLGGSKQLGNVAGRWAGRLSSAAYVGHRIQRRAQELESSGQIESANQYVAQNMRLFSDFNAGVFGAYYAGLQGGVLPSAKDIVERLNPDSTEVNAATDLDNADKSVPTKEIGEENIFKNRPDAQPPPDLTALQGDNDDGVLGQETPIRGRIPNSGQPFDYTPNQPEPTPEINVSLYGDANEVVIQNLDDEKLANWAAQSPEAQYAATIGEYIRANPEEFGLSSNATGNEVANLALAITRNYGNWDDPQVGIDRWLENPSDVPSGDSPYSTLASYVDRVGLESPSPVDIGSPVDTYAAITNPGDPEGIDQMNIAADSITEADARNWATNGRGGTSPTGGPGSTGYNERMMAYRITQDVFEPGKYFANDDQIEQMFYGSSIAGGGDIDPDDAVRITEKIIQASGNYDDIRNGTLDWDNPTHRETIINNGLDYMSNHPNDRLNPLESRFETGDISYEGLRDLLAGAWTGGSGSPTPPGGPGGGTPGGGLPPKLPFPHPGWGGPNVNIWGDDNIVIIQIGNDNIAAGDDVNINQDDDSGFPWLPFVVGVGLGAGLAGGAWALNRRRGNTQNQQAQQTTEQPVPPTPPTPPTIDPLTAETRPNLRVEENQAATETPAAAENQAAAETPADVQTEALNQVIEEMKKLYEEFDRLKQTVEGAPPPQQPQTQPQSGDINIENNNTNNINVDAIAAAVIQQVMANLQATPQPGVYPQNGMFWGGMPPGYVPIMYPVVAPNPFPFNGGYPPANAPVNATANAPVNATADATANATANVDVPQGGYNIHLGDVGAGAVLHFVFGGQQAPQQAPQPAPQTEQPAGNPVKVNENLNINNAEGGDAKVKNTINLQIIIDGRVDFNEENITVEVNTSDAGTPPAAEEGGEGSGPGSLGGGPGVSAAVPTAEEGVPPEEVSSADLGSDEVEGGGVQPVEVLGTGGGEPPDGDFGSEGNQPGPGSLGGGPGASEAEPPGGGPVSVEEGVPPAGGNLGSGAAESTEESSKAIVPYQGGVVPQGDILSNRVNSGDQPRRLPSGIPEPVPLVEVLDEPEGGGSSADLVSGSDEGEGVPTVGDLGPGSGEGEVPPGGGQTDEGGAAKASQKQPLGLPKFNELSPRDQADEGSATPVEPGAGGGPGSGEGALSAVPAVEGPGSGAAESEEGVPPGGGPVSVEEGVPPAGGNLGSGAAESEDPAAAEPELPLLETGQLPDFRQPPEAPVSPVTPEPQEVENFEQFNSLAQPGAIVEFKNPLTDEVINRYEVKDSGGNKVLVEIDADGNPQNSANIIINDKLQKPLSNSKIDIAVTPVFQNPEFTPQQPPEPPGTGNPFDPATVNLPEVPENLAEDPDSGEEGVPPTPPPTEPAVEGSGGNQPGPGSLGGGPGASEAEPPGGGQTDEGGAAKASQEQPLGLPKFNELSPRDQANEDSATPVEPGAGGGPGSGAAESEDPAAAEPEPPGGGQGETNDETVTALAANFAENKLRNGMGFQMIDGNITPEVVGMKGGFIYKGEAMTDGSGGQRQRVIAIQKKLPLADSTAGSPDQIDTSFGTKGTLYVRSLDELRDALARYQN